MQKILFTLELFQLRCEKVTGLKEGNPAVSSEEQRTKVKDVARTGRKEVRPLPHLASSALALRNSGNFPRFLGFPDEAL